VTFSESVQTCFGKYGTFDGRASRSEFWWFYLANIAVVWIANFVFSVTGYMTGGQEGAILLSNLMQFIINLVFFIPFLAASSRRLHDTNRSAWWVLLLITIIGIIPLIMWWAQKGDELSNNYGQPTEIEGEAPAVPPAVKQQEEVPPLKSSPPPSPPASQVAALSAEAKSDAVMSAAQQDAPAMQADFTRAPSAPLNQLSNGVVPTSPRTSTSTGAIIIGVVVVLIAIIAAALYLKPWNSGATNPDPQTPAVLTETKSPIADPAEPKTGATKPTRKNNQKSKAPRTDTIEAGDVSIQEDENGNMRIRAGDIIIEE
jgi:uncharacterized membrane protein YhaH (DUF805 family)